MQKPFFATQYPWEKRFIGSAVKSLKMDPQKKSPKLKFSNYSHVMHRWICFLKQDSKIKMKRGRKVSDVIKQN